MSCLKPHDEMPGRWLLIVMLVAALAGIVIATAEKLAHGMEGDSIVVTPVDPLVGGSTMSVSVASMIDTCFAPEMKCDQKLADFMRQAQIDLDVAIYDINYPVFVQAIEEVNKRANVRVVVDKQQSETKSSLVMELVRAGVPVKYGHQRGIMHNKFTIVDRQAIETGSFNYTDRATKANHENQIYVSDLDTVRDYVQEFETMWAEGVPVQ